jgi:hypothetical protein
VAKELIADSWVAIRAQFDDDDLDTVLSPSHSNAIKKVRSQHPIMMIIKWPYPAKRRRECLAKPI